MIKVTAGQPREAEHGRLRYAPIALALALLAVALLSANELAPTHAGATITRIVNTTDDTTDGSGCEPIHCSLREAIEAANTLPPILGDRTLIHFNIPGCPPACTISLSNSLPAIQADSTVVDGTTQPGYTNSPLVIVDRASVLGSAVLTLGGDGITVRGLQLQHSPGTDTYGLYITGNSFLIEENVMTNNFHAIHASGTPSFTSGTVVNNTVIDNEQRGISLTGANAKISGNTVSGNRTGITVDNGFDATNAEIFENSVTGNEVDGMVLIGAGTEVYDNVVTGNGNHGISAVIAQGVPDGQIYENQVTGSGEIGIFLEGDNIIARSNYVAGSGFEGIAGFLMEGGIIEDNILFQNGQSLTPDRMAGIAVWSDDVIVRGNDLQANRGHGIVAGGDNVTLGGTSPNDMNHVNLSTGAGILVPYGDLPFGDTGPTHSGVSILGNNIGPSDSIGIDLQQDGHAEGIVTQNDTGDGDSGNNNLQNFPMLTAAYAASLHVEGALNSTPNTQFRIEVFSNEECDPTGYGEGQLFMGAVNTTTDGSGNAEFTFDSSDFPLGPFITATATNNATGDSSEFSQCIETTDPPTPTPTPIVTATPTVTQTQTGTPAATPSPAGTPTSTATPGDLLIFGDVNCSGAVDPVDTLALLRADAGLSVNKLDPDCPDIGDPVALAGLAAIPQGDTLPWGDVDCDFAVSPIDALKVLRHDAALSVSQAAGCPQIGEPL